MIPNIKRLYDSLGRYRALYLLSAFELIIIISWILHANIDGSTDVDSYYSAYNIIMSGEIDEDRTPLYPLIIGGLKSIAGLDVSRTIVIILQAIVFLCSINWFGKTLENVVSYKRISYWFTAVYALYPGMLTFCGLIITESFAISLVSALIYLISEAYFHNSFMKAALSGMLCLLLWLLRPALMPVSFIAFLFWICLLTVKRGELRKTAICGLSATLVSLAGIGIYAMMFYKEYHIVGLTTANIRNNYYLIRESGVMNTDLVENPEIKATIDSIIKKGANLQEDNDIPFWFEIEKLHDVLGVREYDKFINQQIRHHSQDIASFIYHDRLDKFLDYDCVSPGKYGSLPPQVVTLIRIFRINNGMVFLIILTGMVGLLYMDIKNRRISYFIWLLYSLSIVLYLTILIGAMNDYVRLNAPNYPVLLSVSCCLLNMLVYFAADDKKMPKF